MPTTYTKAERQQARQFLQESGAKQLSFYSDGWIVRRYWNINGIVWWEKESSLEVPEDEYDLRVSHRTLDEFN